MGVYKKVKFPFEITKGKADDLFRLRFMRKSEIEPTVRHNLKFYTCQMDKQLEVWFKEQLFTVGYISKEQEKLNKSRARLRQAVRLAKREQYMRHQEELRKKLKEIKLRIMMMKVVQRFKENAKINKMLREHSFGEQTSLKGKVDFLRIAGNRQFLHDKKHDNSEEDAPINETLSSTDHSQESKRYNAKGKVCNKNIQSKDRLDTQKLLHKEKEFDKHVDMEKHDKDAKNIDGESNVNAQDERSERVVNKDRSSELEADCEEEYEAEYNSDETARMATIPEEDEVELEIQDVRGKTGYFSGIDIKMKVYHARHET